MSKGDVVVFDVGKYGMIARRSGSTIIINYEGAEYQRPEKDHEIVVRASHPNYYEALAICLPHMFHLKTGPDKFLTVYLNETSMQQAMPKLTPVDAYSRKYMKTVFPEIARSHLKSEYVKVLVLHDGTDETLMSRLMRSREDCILIHTKTKSPHYNLSSVWPSGIFIAHARNKFFFSWKKQPNQMYKAVIFGIACLRRATSGVARDELHLVTSSLNIPKI